ncbi:hypothetical protein PV327_007654 [Microctonus hyperodae]|uniref:Uncharacterized protein n=1 Tax=Microctonus hyperodae TaxID=165561 RepID=A0AA39G0Y5_MICHY|nr:hypothetical protein PV327_007654 [Microctonus hyperodae]
MFLAVNVERPKALMDYAQIVSISYTRMANDVDARLPGRGDDDDDHDDGDGDGKDEEEAMELSNLTLSVIILTIPSLYISSPTGISVARSRLPFWMKGIIIMNVAK